MRRNFSQFKATPEGAKRIGKTPKQTVYGNKTMPGRLLAKLGGQMETKRAQDWVKAQRRTGRKTKTK